MTGSARIIGALVAAAALAGGCARQPAGLEIQNGTEVSVEKHDGAAVAGRLVEVQPETVILEGTDGQRVRVPRAEIRALRAVTGGGSPSARAETPAPAPPAAPDAPSAPRPDESGGGGPSRAAAAADRTGARADEAADADPPAPPAPAYRVVQIPAGTVLPIALRTAVGSATSRVEDQVRGTLRRAIVIDGVEVVPAGTVVAGTVTQAERSGRVKGRARVAFRFAMLDLPGERPRLPIRTAVIAREAEGTKKEDAAKIGGGAAAGAVIGGIVGGGDGAAKGAAIGGGAGTGVVLATRGREVSLPAGTSVSARLLDPVVVRVPR